MWCEEASIINELYCVLYNTVTSLIPPSVSFSPFHIPPAAWESMLSPWQISIPLDIRERKTRVTKEPSKMVKHQSLIRLQDSPCEKYGTDKKRKQERRKSSALPVQTWCQPRIADSLPSVNDGRRYTPTRHDLAAPRMFRYRIGTHAISKNKI